MLERAVRARSATETCPLVLVGDTGVLRLGTLDRKPRHAAVGPAPEDCGTCLFELQADDAGVVLIYAFRREPEGEPVWPDAVGLAHGGALDFVDLTEGAGLDRVVQGTNLGPAHRLQARLRQGGLDVEVVAAFPGAENAPVPESLAARAGRYELRNGVLTQVGPAQAGTRQAP